MKKYLPLLKGILLYVLLTGATVLMSFPLFWMISSSLKTLQETNSPGIVWVPRQPTLEAYTAIFHNQNFLRSYFNSVFYVTLALAGTLISIAAVSYAFSRIEWPGRNIVFFLMLSTMMIPAQALIVPQYVFFNKLHWIGTFNPLIIPGYFAGGAAMIFLLRQFMAQIPRELDESAFVDGASHVQIWWNISHAIVRGASGNNCHLPLCRYMEQSAHTVDVFTDGRSIHTASVCVHALQHQPNHPALAHDHDGRGLDHDSSDHHLFLCAALYS